MATLTLRLRSSIKLLPLALIALLACTQSDGGFHPVRALTGADINADDEREIGFAVDRAIREQVPIIEDPVVTEFIHELGQSIVGTIEPQPFRYRFRVIDDHRLNAFALPGGFIYFHSGTLLTASSIDEVAGVMAHEIGHVKGRHHTREQQKMAIPNLLAAIAGIAATVATDEGGAMVMAQAANVALQLSFRREFEAEADQLGMNFMTRAGYNVEGLERFFERLAVTREYSEIEIPPYLFSHPDVETRVVTVREAIPNIRRTETSPVHLEAAFYRAQERLALLKELKTQSLRKTRPAFDRGTAQPLLRQASVLREEGKLEEALEQLRRAEKRSGLDPRPPFERGLILSELNRHREAIQAYDRTLQLDPDRAPVLYHLGLAYRDLGDASRAIYYLDRAYDNFSNTSAMREKTRWEIEQIDFMIFRAAGLLSSLDKLNSNPKLNPNVDVFRPGDPEVVWWGKLGSHFGMHPRFQRKEKTLKAHWRDPQGKLFEESKIDGMKKLHVTYLELSEAHFENPGTWKVEILLDGDVIAEASFKLEAST